MATAATSPAELKETKSGHAAINRVTLPYIIAIVAQLPLLLYYFSTLWARPHYQFFPFAIIMVVAFAVIRWPRNLDEPFFRRRFSVVLFWIAIVFGVAGALFATAWLSAASMIMLMTSLFAMTKDGEMAGKSLLVLSLNFSKPTNSNICSILCSFSAMVCSFAFTEPRNWSTSSLSSSGSRLLSLP